MTRIDSQRAVSVLAGADPEFTELTRTLYGGDLPAEKVWADVFAKISPDPSDVHSPAALPPRRRTNRAARAAAVTATTVGTLLGAKELAEETPKALRIISTTDGAGGLRGRRAFRTRAGWVTRNPDARVLPRVPRPGPAARVAGTTAMFGGDILATHQLRHADDDDPVRKSIVGDLAEGFVRQTRQVVDRLVPAATGRHRVPGMKPPGGGAKPRPMGDPIKPGPGQGSMFDAGGNPAPDGATAGSQRGQDAGFKIGQAWRGATSTPGRKAATYTGLGVAGAAAVHHHRAGQQAAPAYPGPTPYYYSKRSEREVEVEWAGTFSKLDNDKRLAFGWASMSKFDGLPVVDRQDDIILPEDIEDAVYHYVQHSRVGGDMHRRTGFGKYARSGSGLQLVVDEPHKVSDLVESMVFTDEKVEKMGLPDNFPRGWWVGFRYHDDDAWADVKEGRKTGFSIHGKGIRTPVDLDDLMYGAVH